MHKMHMILGLGLLGCMMAMPSFSIDGEPESGGDGGYQGDPSDSELDTSGYAEAGDPAPDSSDDDAADGAGEGANEAAEESASDDEDQADEDSEDFE